MIVLNSLRPTEEQMKMFMEFPDDKPIKMVNLLKFKNKAELDIMFSNDNKKYPVMIRLKLKYGYLKLELDQVIN